MPLPKISTPTYELVLPSNNKKIKYRPFLVREEKILILALESNDSKQVSDAIVDILTSCILTKNIDVTTLPTFDIEYLFLNVRSKSVGETVEVNVTCPDDGVTAVEMAVNIDSIKVKKTKGHSNIIKLDDKYSMKLKYPSMKQFIENNFDVEETNVNQSLSMLSGCIDMVYDEEESWDASDCSQEELDGFIDQLNTKQFKEVEKFFDSMPKLSHKVKVTNPKTGVESDIVLIGVSRTSKTPTSIYLANKGLKTSNIPLVNEMEIPKDLIESKNLCVVGLITEAERLFDIRRNRLNSLKEKEASDYTDLEKIKIEVERSKKIFKKNKWPTIDVTRKSVEETAASIIKIYEIKNKNV